MPGKEATRRSAALPRGCQTVFHQLDAHGTGSDWLGALLIAGKCVTQGHRVHPVDGNLMFAYEVALDRFGHSLRALDTDAAGSGSMCLDFKNVSLMTGQGCGQVIQLLAGRC